MSALSLNRVGVPEGEITAAVGRMIAKAAARKKDLDATVLGQMLRDQLPNIAGRVSDETFSALMGICAVLLNHGAQAVLADHLAAIAVAQAKSGGKPV